MTSLVDLTSSTERNIGIAPKKSNGALLNGMLVPTNDHPVVLNGGGGDACDLKAKAAMDVDIEMDTDKPVDNSLDESGDNSLAKPSADNSLVEPGEISLAKQKGDISLVKPLTNGSVVENVSNDMPSAFGDTDAAQQSSQKRSYQSDDEGAGDINHPVSKSAKIEDDSVLCDTNNSDKVPSQRGVQNSEESLSQTSNKYEDSNHVITDNIRYKTDNGDENSVESGLSSLDKDSLSSHPTQTDDIHLPKEESSLLNNDSKLNPLSIGNGLKNSFKGILQAAIKKVASDSELDPEDFSMDKADEDALLGESDENSKSNMADNEQDDSAKNANDSSAKNNMVVDREEEQNTEDVLLSNGVDCELISEIDENSLLDRDDISDNKSNAAQKQDSITNDIDSNRLLEESQNSCIDNKKQSATNCDNDKTEVNEPEVIETISESVKNSESVENSESGEHSESIDTPQTVSDQSENVREMAADKPNTEEITKERDQESDNIMQSTSETNCAQAQPDPEDAQTPKESSIADTDIQNLPISSDESLNVPSKSDDNLSAVSKPNDNLLNVSNIDQSNASVSNDLEPMDDFIDLLDESNDEEKQIEEVNKEVETAEKEVDNNEVIEDNEKEDNIEEEACPNKEETLNNATDASNVMDKDKASDSVENNVENMEENIEKQEGFDKSEQAALEESNDVDMKETNTESNSDRESASVKSEKVADVKHEIDIKCPKTETDTQDSKSSVKSELDLKTESEQLVKDEKPDSNALSEESKSICDGVKQESKKQIPCTDLDDTKSDFGELGDYMKNDIKQVDKTDNSLLNASETGANNTASDAVCQKRELTENEVIDLDTTEHRLPNLDTKSTENDQKENLDTASTKSTECENVNLEKQISNDSENASVDLGGEPSTIAHNTEKSGSAETGKKPAETGENPSSADTEPIGDRSSADSPIAVGSTKKRSAESPEVEGVAKKSRIDGLVGGLLSRLGKRVEEVKSASDAEMDEGVEEEIEMTEPEGPTLEFNEKKLKYMLKKTVDDFVREHNTKLEKQLAQLRRDLSALHAVSSASLKDMKDMRKKRAAVSLKNSGGAASKKTEQQAGSGGSNASSRSGTPKALVPQSGATTPTGTPQRNNVALPVKQNAAVPPPKSPVRPIAAASKTPPSTPPHKNPKHRPRVTNSPSAGAYGTRSQKNGSNTTVREMLREKRSSVSNSNAVVDLTEDDDKPETQSAPSTPIGTVAPTTPNGVIPGSANGAQPVRPGTYYLQTGPAGNTILVPTLATGAVVLPTTTTSTQQPQATQGALGTVVARPTAPAQNAVSTAGPKQKSTARKRTAPRRNPSPEKQVSQPDATEANKTVRKRTAQRRNSPESKSRSPSPDLMITTVTPAAPAKQHPAPLPAQPTSQGSAPHMKQLPPKAQLKISRVNQGIVLSWNMQLSADIEDISSYQLFAYQESSAAPSANLWKKVGDVKALALPMACTLTQFQEGNKYHFAVRAADKHKRVGVFSDPCSIHLTKM